MDTPLHKEKPRGLNEVDDELKRIEFSATAHKNKNQMRDLPDKRQPLPQRPVQAYDRPTLVEPKWPIVDIYDRRDTSEKVDQMKEIIKKLAIHIDPKLKPKDEKVAEPGVIGKTLNAVGSILGYNTEKKEEKKDDTKQ
jgi:hypothetical protein